MALVNMKTINFITPLLWFLLTNAGVCLLLSINLSLFGLDAALLREGIGLRDIWLGVLLLSSLAAAGLILGSRLIIHYYLGARMVHEPTDTKLQQLKIIIAQQARVAKIRAPALAVYESPEMNAFAVGSGRWDSVLVVSQSLLDGLTLDELSAVVGHEMTHITNGDMLTLSFMQAVVNICVYFPAYLLGSGLDRLFFRHRHFRPIYKSIRLFLQLSLGGIASLIVMWFSRQREFRADAGGAQLAGYAEMMAALRSLQAGRHDEVAMHPFWSFGLNAYMPDSGLWRLFTSHPSLAERIKALYQSG